MDMDMDIFLFLGVHFYFILLIYNIFQHPSCDITGENVTFAWTNYIDDQEMVQYKWTTDDFVIIVEKRPRHGIWPNV